MVDIFTLTLMTILLSFIYVLWQQIKQQVSRPKSRLDRSLDRQLLTMLNGDRKTALRLLRGSRKNNPGRSYLWYHEKVIRDLLRDRRG